MARILIGGDLAPLGSNLPPFQQGDAVALFSDLLGEFKKADLAIVNLECPLITQETPISKTGPVIGADPSCVRGIKAAGIGAVSLANNHIMDHGVAGLETTIRALEENGIGHVGAGPDMAAARRILVREAGGVRVGVLAVAEHEFCVAGKGAPGANPLDVIDFVRNVRGHRGEYDRLVVILHGGNEYYPYPRPGLMDTCRFFVEEGANAVICQHSHCVGCMETWQGAPIVYGQGNLLFDWPKAAGRAWHEGLLVALEFGGCPAPAVDLIPYKQSEGGPGARRMLPEDELVFWEEFNGRSEQITDETFVAEQWRAFCQKTRRHYLGVLRGDHGIVRRAANKLGLSRFSSPPEIQRARLNMIRCESHREALLSVLSTEARQ